MPKQIKKRGSGGGDILSPRTEHEAIARKRPHRRAALSRKQLSIQLVSSNVALVQHPTRNSYFVHQYWQLAVLPLGDAIQKLTKGSFKKFEPGIYRVITNAWEKPGHNKSFLHFTIKTERTDIPFTKQRRQSKKRRSY